MTVMFMMTRRNLLKTGVGLAAVAPIWQYGAATAQRVDRVSWLYTTAQGYGVIQTQGGRQWVETTPTGLQWTFEETAQTTAYVELHDPTRGLRLRLRPNFTELRKEPDDTWARFLAGRWVTPEEVPPLSDYRIRLAHFVPSDRTPVSNYEEKIR